MQSPCSRCRDSESRSTRWRAAISGRLTCPKCGRTYHPVLAPPKLDRLCDRDSTPLIERDDDKAETARHRIGVYLDQTLPVLEHYRKQGVVAEVSGEGDIEDVRRRVLEAIGRSDREQR